MKIIEQNSLTSKFIRSKDNNQDDNIDRVICNGRNCERRASKTIEESVGKFGRMRLYLCMDCIKKFQK
jgi:hypothetical protein